MKESEAAGSEETGKKSADGKGAPKAEKGLTSLRALRHRDFALFWSAALLSNAANWMHQFTVLFVMYELTESNAWVGAAAFSVLVPVLILNPLAGVMADRFPRRTTIMATLSFQASVSIMFTAVWVTDSITPRWIVLLNLLAGVAAGFQIVNWQALVPLLVPKESVLAAIRLNSIQFTAARAIGPLTGASLLGLLGAGAVFAGNAVMFAVLLAVVASVRPRVISTPRTERVRDVLREGFRYVRRRAALMQSVLTGFFIAYFGGALIHLAPGLAKADLGVGETGLAGLITAAGTGSVAASVFIVRYADYMERSRMTRWGMIIYAAAPLLVAASTYYPLALAGYFVMGVAHVNVAIAMNTTIQAQVSEEMRGRALSIYLMGIFGGWPMGSLIGGWLGDVVGLRAVFAFNGLVLGAYLCAALIWFDGFRRLDPDCDALGASGTPSVPGASGSPGASGVSSAPSVPEGEPAQQPPAQQPPGSSA